MQLSDEKTSEMQAIESEAGQSFLFIKLCSLESISKSRNKYLKAVAINVSRWYVYG